jgi:hypothetical protein
MIDDPAILSTSTDEMRDLARVLKAAFLMVVRYLERRYKV